MKYNLYDLFPFGSYTVLVRLKNNIEHRGYFTDSGKDKISTYFKIKLSGEEILIPMEDIDHIERTNP